MPAIHLIGNDMKEHDLLVPLTELAEDTYLSAINAEWDGDHDKAEQLWKDYKRYLDMIEDGILYEPLF